jgi:hypothetical protein
MEKSLCKLGWQEDDSNGMKTIWIMKSNITGIINDEIHAIVNETDSSTDWSTDFWCEIFFLVW